MMSANSWYIAGQGAIGSLVASTAQSHDINVEMIVRTDKTKQRLFFVDHHKNSWGLPQAKTLQQCNDIKNLFIPLKSYDVIPFLKQILDKLSPQANIVLCHNGLGTIEDALEILPDTCQLYFCITNNGVYKENEQIIHAGLGESFCSLVTKPNNNQVQARLTESDFSKLLPDCKASEDLDSLLWRKLMINCAINPLTAIEGIKNGNLSDPKYLTKIKQILDEAHIISSALEIKIDRDEIESIVFAVINATALNTSSMAQDVLKGKQTEIDYINGYISKMGKALSIATPLNDQLVSQIKSLNVD